MKYADITTRLADLGSAKWDIHLRAKERIVRFQTLTTLHRDNPETRMLEAELQIAAEDFPAARKALGDLPEKDPTARSLTIMAAVERGSGADDGVVKGWVARALTAPRGPKWVCDNCQKSHGDWGPVCDNCGGFDTLSWRRASDDVSAIPAGTEMLPLIVGQIAHHDVEIEDAIVADVIDEDSPEEADGGDPKAGAATANADAPPADFIADAEQPASDDTPLKKDAT